MKTKILTQSSMIKKIFPQKIKFQFWSLIVGSFFCFESSYAQLKIKSTMASSNGAEISAFDPTTNRIFTVAGSTIEYYTLSSAGILSSPTIIPYGFSVPLGSTAIPNSVAVKNGILVFSFAVVGANNVQQLGKVAFYNPATGAYISDVTVGFLPDMIAFSPNGTKILTADEGEPNSYNQSTSFDPVGSVSIIDMSSGIVNATVSIALFTNFNSHLASLKASGVRIYGPNATVSQDLEPEYITFIDNTTAVVSLQENNAVATINIATATVTNIYPLGLKDHSLIGNGFDPSDRDLTSTSGKINIQNWPVKGMYMPDAIASFKSGSKTYFITANEGDSRDYTGYSEERRVGATGTTGYTLDPTVFPNAATLKSNANLGRLQLSTATGDTDGDGDFDEIHALGARSFTIWDSTFTKVFDSGDQLEQITATQNATSFNSDGTSSSFDSRSDNKGPEPEGVTTGIVNGVLYAFVGSERTGDVFVYDITIPTAPIFKQYINTTADIAVEGIIFIPATQSPTGNALVITSAEVSKTITVYEFTPPTITATAGTISCFGGTTTISISASGTIAPYSGTGTFTVSAGTYTYSVTDANGLIATQIVTISEPTALVASNSAGTIACNGGTTLVIVSATGGFAPYSGIGTITVNAGSYSYAVTDANGCASIVSGFISAPAPIATVLNITEFGSYTIPGTSTAITTSGITNQVYTASNTCDSIVTYNVTIYGVVVCAKAFLSGCYNATTGLMRDSLRAKGLLPLSTPYGIGAYTTGYSNVNNTSIETTTASVLTVTGNNAIVDWVFVQIRSKVDSSIVLGTRSALIQCDGDIVDMDGTSALTFTNIISDDYFVSIKHRNHIGIMTANKYALSLTANCIDFTTTSTPLFVRTGRTGNPTPLTGSTRVQNGVRTLYAGNCNILTTLTSRYITYNASTISDKLELFIATGGTNTINGYSIYDTDMNGFARFNGLNPDRNVILNNCAGSITLITYEQTPN